MTAAAEARLAAAGDLTRNGDWCTVALPADEDPGAVPDLVLLVIDTERVRPELRYEQVPGQPDPYPHIYGPLNLDAVLETRPFQPPAPGP